MCCSVVSETMVKGTCPEGGENGGTCCKNHCMGKVRHATACILCSIVSDTMAKEARPEGRNQRHGVFFQHLIAIIEVEYE